jgi:hypothetical protein
MAQQTAVEWLDEQLNKWSDGRFYLPPHLFEQAKQMEKEQIMNAFFMGRDEITKKFVESSEQYYNETYKKE